MKKMLVISLVLGLLLVGSVSFFTYYQEPNLIGENWNCNSERGQTGLPYKSRPLPFESSQHYVNRINDVFQKQMMEACD